MSFKDFSTAQDVPVKVSPTDKPAPVPAADQAAALPGNKTAKDAAPKP